MGKMATIRIFMALPGNFGFCGRLFLQNIIINLIFEKVFVSRLNRFVIPLIGCPVRNPSVLQVYGPVRVIGVFGIVGNHDDCLALFIAADAATAPHRRLHRETPAGHRPVLFSGQNLHNSAPIPQAGNDTGKALRFCDLRIIGGDDPPRLHVYLHRSHPFLRLQRLSDLSRAALTGHAKGLESHYRIGALSDPDEKGETRHDRHGYEYRYEILLIELHISSLFEVSSFGEAVTN